METTTNSVTGTWAKLLAALIPGLIFHYSAAAADLSLEGVFQGKNLYVQNPEMGDGFGYCVKKVSINGNITPANLSSGAFEIDFVWLSLNHGDHVTIVIEHQEGYKPTILNPEVLLPRSTFKVTSMQFNPQETLSWTTESETGALPYIVEQYRWNKWISTGSIPGSGQAGTNTYHLKLTPHSGQNKVRVVQIDYSGTKRTSLEYTFESNVAAVEKSEEKVRDAIHFKANGTTVETLYEIYDAYGNRVMKGWGSIVPCVTLEKGLYYINFDNRTEKFLKV